MNENKNAPGIKAGVQLDHSLDCPFPADLFNLFTMYQSSTSAMQISYDQFLDLVEAGIVNQVHMNDD